MNGKTSEHRLKVNAAYREANREHRQRIRDYYCLTGDWLGYPSHHPDILKVERQKRYQENTEQHYEASRAWVAANPEKARAYKAKHKKKPGAKERANARHRQRQREDPNFGILVRVRRRLHAALSGRKITIRSLALIGCSRQELREHIERQFLPGMSWDNWGEWHVDHIWPMKHFDLTDPRQLRVAAHYKNLRPLWAEDNFRRSSNMSPEEQAAFDAWKAEL